MLKIKNRLSKKDRQEILISMHEWQDTFGEAFITRNKLRIYIKENFDVVNNLLSKGDKICFGEDGIAIITGYAEKTIEIVDFITKEKTIIPSRKYVKILAKDERNAYRLLEFINYQLPNISLFAKIKLNNPILKVYYKNGFLFLASRGKEVLVCRKPIKIIKTSEQIYKENERPKELDHVR
jgi:hypothetical protein